MKRNAISRALIAAAIALAGPSSAAADWPLYGHDLANSRSAGRAGPSASALAGLGRAWTFSSTNGDFTGTPVVANGTLVAGTSLGTIYALDAVSGKLRWSRNVGEQINGSAAIDLAAPGGPTAFVPIAQVGSPRLVALSLRTGKLRWDVVLGRAAGADVYGSPIYWHRTVYIGTSGPNNDESSARGSVVALNERTGAQRWRTYTVPRGDDGGAVWSTPAIDTKRGRLYVGTGNAYHAPAASTTDSMLMLAARDGRILGHYQSLAGDVWELDAPTGGPDHDFGASPNLFRGPAGHPLVGEGSKSGTYWALDRATMKPVWSTMVGPGSSVGGILGSTAYDGTRIYGNDTADGEVWSLGRGGASRWSGTDGGTVNFSPVSVANGVVYSITGVAGILTARSASNGAVIAKLSLGSPTFGGVSAVGRALYVETGTGPAPQIAPYLPPTTKLDSNGTIVAFGDTSRSGAHHRRHHRSDRDKPGDHGDNGKDP
ncbi:MAG: PQQ-binding-like beta-propeller repeat protein [Actinobacteria bacterium]|nr:PQQ-binding-like beta-propeller repeat protein [Actinomycetota bacterium]